MKKLTVVIAAAFVCLSTFLYAMKPGFANINLNEKPAITDSVPPAMSDTSLHKSNMHKKGSTKSKTDKTANKMNVDTAANKANY